MSANNKKMSLVGGERLSLNLRRIVFNSQDTNTIIDGKEVTMQVKKGQKVIYSKYSGTNVKLDNEEYIIVKQSDILAVVE